MHKRAVILGAGGFIGINLAAALAEDGCEVICFDRFYRTQWPRNAKYVNGDFTDMPPDLLAMLDNATVYHLVSSCRPSQSTQNAADEIVTDVAITLRYLEHTRGRNIRWIFVSSGGTVYGPNVPCPTTEEAPNDPICSYGLVKLTLERYYALYKQMHGIDYVVARVSNPYGPWQDPLGGQGVIAALIYKALVGQDVEIWGDGDNVRDYLYIDDAVRGLIDLAKYGEGGEIYNVSSGYGTTINDLLQIIGLTLGTHLNPHHMGARKSDVRKSILSNYKLYRKSGWSPKHRLIDGIKLTAKWMHENVLINK